MFSVQATTNGVTSRCESPPPPRENGLDATGFSRAVTSIRSATRFQESAIFSRSCGNPSLKPMIELLPDVHNQDKRFSALGMGITAVANFRGINSSNCDVNNWCGDVLKNNPRDPAHRDNISSDPAMAMRGADLVDFMSFGKNEGLVDTLYAQTIAVGKSVQEGRISDGTSTLISHANTFLDLVKSGSVQ
ncbi:hypothetical protein [Pandoraea horticolens]|uniref:hypothetical protein n=1 Tax=Pandoraea horticolens TaxID=2508298 RepID=UPI0012415319|nr:hypothetical protein [Pandoraea horticolens]